MCRTIPNATKKQFELIYEFGKIAKSTYRKWQYYFKHIVNYLKIEIKKAISLIIATKIPMRAGVVAHW